MGPEPDGPDDDDDGPIIDATKLSESEINGRLFAAEPGAHVPVPGGPR